MGEIVEICVLLPTVIS